MHKERHLPHCKGFLEKANLAKQNVSKIGNEGQQQQVQEANHECGSSTSSMLEQSSGKKELESETGTEILQVESLTTNSSGSQLDPPFAPPAKKKKPDSK